ncbi:hypothetical protein [Streptomyces sp. H27-D2]|uniref:hypothetical protein n=1 Tax=Streptomyces sp. H27-D2 TaxID=3046304 RepID=UPI002DB7805F|nr:hypothetical protein [Streptomyces sp. H27-D2]MEC4016450.1 hypothetical protein [Streptomyces sp. H27-D2]
MGDDGPGFPAGHVPQRGSSGGCSTGLGPDIVRRAAEGSGGSVEWGVGASPTAGAPTAGAPATPRGARITVRFGPGSGSGR